VLASLTGAPLTNADATPLPRVAITPSFCQHLSLAKVGSVVGSRVTLVESTVKKTVTACIYSGVPGNMSIETQVKMPSSQTRSLSAAEAATKSMFPAGLKISFATVSGMGPVAFTWHAVIGSPYGGLNVVKGSTGYFVEVGGALHLSELEALERLAFAA
jgi:hypothetical protein